MGQEELTGLIAGAMAGDDEAFESLYKMNSNGILFHTRNLIYNVNDVEDVAQEIILQMYKGIGTLKSPYAFSAWMHRIIRNVCTRHNEKFSKRRQDLSLDEEEVFIEDGDVDARPEAAAERGSLNGQIMAAIEKLPEKQRMTLVMSYYDEMSLAEIGEVLEVSAKTASTNLMKAKRNLKNMLGDEFREYGEDSGQPIAASAIAVALRDAADEAGTLVDKNSFWQGCDARIVEYKAGGGATAQAHGRVGGKVGFGGNGMIAIATLVSVVATALIVGFFVIHPPAAVDRAEDPVSEVVSEAVPTETLLPEAEVVFESEGEGSENINPVRASVKIEGPDYVPVSWRITDSAGVELFSGQGEAADAVFGTLSSGEYRIAWLMEGTDGETATVHRDFTVA
ncbi:MAG: sigma-70 family RNA polymerase sigma factor [Clostridiales Family XIII bacterium]|jgi:RNA polymerase sigma-70 factor (ECF subfamily)|nr:sigma-70 family RNA polymerase sigma factor [Clostridiales Family XIII bacterium]